MIDEDVFVWMVYLLKDDFELDSIWPTKARAEERAAMINKETGGEMWVTPARPDLVVTAVLENKAAELRSILDKMGLVLAQKPEAQQ